jgi:hypothetical protein
MQSSIIFFSLKLNQFIFFFFKNIKNFIENHIFFSIVPKVAPFWKIEPNDKSVIVGETGNQNYRDCHYYNFC